MKYFLYTFTLFYISFTSFLFSQDRLLDPESDHEKAIKAVNDGEILTLDKILEKINRKFEGRVLSINLKDSEKGLFGWVYDIMIIDVNNKVKQVRVDAGTSTVLSVISGD